MQKNCIFRLFIFIGFLVSGNWIAVAYLRAITAQPSDWIWPWDFLVAFIRNPHEFGQSEHKIAILIILAFYWIGFVVVVLRDRAINSSDIHGSAKWATAEDIKKMGLIDQDHGVYIGGLEFKGKGLIKYLRENTDRHGILVAPTRAGKTSSLIIPTALSWKGSILFYDIKGEIWELSSGYRKNELKSTVIKYEPTNSDGSSARFNPLYEIRPGDQEVKDAQNIADILAEVDIEDHTAHWREKAQSVLVGTMLHVLYAERDKSLPGVLSFLTTSRHDFKYTLELMVSTQHDPDGKWGWRSELDGKPVLTHPVVSSVAQELLNKSENERSSILSTAIRYLEIFRDPIVARNSMESDFQIMDLVNEDKPVSFYFIVPPSDINRTQPLIRILINLISRRLLENNQTDKTPVTLQRRTRLLILLDEFIALGRIDSFQKSLAFMAGYGVKTYIIVQDLAQLFNTYGVNEEIFGNCHTRIVFAPNKIQTAELISKMSGISTVSKISKQYVRGQAILNQNVSEAATETQRPLLTADEVMRLGDDQAIIFLGNNKPILSRKIKYFEDPVFQARAAMSAIKETDRFHRPGTYWSLMKMKNPVLSLINFHLREQQNDD